MPLTWIDILLAVIILGWVIVEVRRDFGRALFDTLAALVSLRLALLVSPTLAPLFSFAGAENARHGWALAVLFVLFGALALLLARFVHESTQWSMDSFDPVFGCLFGVTAGVIMAHVTVKVLSLIYANSHGVPTFLTDSGLGEELLTFKTYHRFADFLAGFRDRT
jgi:uncharacterized membrane protein required for colicin V production